MYFFTHGALLELLPVLYFVHFLVMQKAKRIGVYGLSSLPNFIMDMVSRTLPRISHIAYNVTLIYALTFLDNEKVHVCVSGLKTIPVINDYLVSISKVRLFGAFYCS